MALCWTLDKLGPLARSARDAESILRAIMGSDPADPTAVDEPFTSSGKRPRIGVIKGATQKTMPGVIKNFNASLKALAEFCDIETGIELPKLPYGPAVGTIVNAEGAAAFRDLIESGRSRELQQKDDRLGGYVAYATAAVDYIDALRQRTFMVVALREAFRGYDAIVSPTLPTVAYPIGVPFDKAYPAFPGAVDLIAAGNLTGLPALALPNGLAEHALPSGIAFLGTAFGEAKLVQIGKKYQQRTRHHLAHPTLISTAPQRA